MKATTHKLITLAKKVNKGEKVYIRGTDEASKHYIWTNKNMLRGEITSVDLKAKKVVIKVLEHKDTLMVDEYFLVNPDFFEYLN